MIVYNYRMAARSMAIHFGVVLAAFPLGELAAYVVSKEPTAASMYASAFLLSFLFVMCDSVWSWTEILRSRVR